MKATEGLAAALFYVGLALSVGGAIVLARRAVERRSGGGRLGIVLLAIGLAGLAISIGIYVTGPRRMLPF
jgi:hypothetical protein